METLRSENLPISYLYSSRYGEGRAAVPVERSQAIYANFRHVSGVPAADGAPAYSVDKLHILDVLIDRLRSAKTEPLAAAEASSSLSSGRVDALIQQYGAELHAIAAAPPMPYVQTASVAEPGMLFSMAA
jgi:hypothetical protein